VPALGALTRKYPALRIEASFEDRLTDLVDAGLDAVVRFGEPRDSRLMVRRVGAIRYFVCAAPSYIEAHGKPHSPDDLGRFACVRRVQHGNASYPSWKLHRRRMANCSIGRSPGR
jgi:DNA-binding transcriptional LysR family regulator